MSQTVPRPCLPTGREKHPEAPSDFFSRPYHIVFVPKYRKQVLYGRTRQRIGRIFHQLCRQKEVGLIEGPAMPDHVHMVLSIPPQHSVSLVLGYLKGKSAIMIHREMERVKHGFTGKHFWAKGYFASTVGLSLIHI